MHAADLLIETLRLRPRVPPDQLAREWSLVRPDGLYALADYEQGGLWLLRRLSDTASDTAAPAAFVTPLRQSVRQAVARNMLVDSEAAAVVRRLAALGIPHVLLKGVARRAARDQLPYGDARITNDVDVLLPAGDVERAWADLHATGYAQAFPRSPHHAPPLIGAGRVAVELHSSLSAGMRPDEAWQRSNDDAQDLVWNGLAVRIPSATELLWHGLSHALPHGGNAWRLRHFLDAAVVLAAARPIAWEVIGRRLDADEIPPKAAPRRWLATAAELAGTPLPPSIVRGARPLDLPRAFRWRLGVLAQRANRGLGGRLLEEGTRSDVGLGIGGVMAGSGRYQHARRRLGGLAARIIYSWWRAWQ